jgi:capsular exopolysaccharide synthesis family protein
MSRIDEALRQSSPGRTVASSTPVTTAEASIAVPDALLDQYPQEEGRRPPEPIAPIARKPEHSGRAPERHPAEPVLSISTDEETAGKLVVSPLASSIYVEQYRRLAAAVHELQSVRPDVKTLLVTSALPKEGKTLTVTNLALTLSESYRRKVLLIDADLRRPSIHKLLNVPNAQGLSDALRSDRVPLPMHQVSPSLCVVPAGRADNDPMGFLASERMKHVIEKAAAGFDCVLIDTPPAGILPDAGILAGVAHGVLFVVAAGSTPYNLVERAVSELGRDLIVGTVMNRIEGHRIPATDYYRDYETVV